MEKEKTDAQITFRMTSSFKARLEAQAEKEHRNVSNMIHRVLTIYLENPNQFKSKDEQ